MDDKPTQTNKVKLILNTLFWGFILWLFGYILGVIFFTFIPQPLIGLTILPFGIAVTLWVLFKKIKREFFKCYIGIGIFWMVMAIVLDYIFIVKAFNSYSYYKADVYVYYALTLLLPMIVGYYKIKK